MEEVHEDFTLIKPPRIVRVGDEWVDGNTVALFMQATLTATTKE